MNARFDPDTHHYYLDNALIPSVTQIMADTGIVDSRWFRDTDRTRGALVHDGTLAIDADDWDEEATQQALPEIYPYLKQYQRVLQELKPAPLLSEEPLFSVKWRFGGTPDRVWKVGEETWLVDIKTGSANAAEIQLALYDILVQESRPAIGKISKRVILNLTNNGKYKITTIPPGQYSSDERVGLSAVTVWWWRRLHNKL